jgi:hypothetical protein
MCLRNSRSTSEWRTTTSTHVLRRRRLNCPVDDEDGVVAIDFSLESGRQCVSQNNQTTGQSIAELVYRCFPCLLIICVGDVIKFLVSASSIYLNQCPLLLVGTLRSHCQIHILFIVNNNKHCGIFTSVFCEKSSRCFAVLSKIIIIVCFSNLKAHTYRAVSVSTDALGVALFQVRVTTPVKWRGRQTQSETNPTKARKRYRAMCCE